MLAPMAGYTDAGFRHIAVRHGAGLTFSEMVSVKGLVYDAKKTKELLYTTAIESPCAVQLFGREPEIFYKAVQSPYLKKFDIIDVNMGCPVPKIVKNGEGSALLKDGELIKDIISAIRRGAPEKTVTVKIRSGYDKVNAVENAAAIEAAGAHAVAVHARLREQYYGGAADINVIKEVKAAVGIPVAGNGDVKGYDDYRRMRETTNCDFVMIGRAAVGNPYIFSDICRRTEAEDGGANSTEPPPSKRADITLHFEILLEYCDERVAVNNIKKHIAAYSKGMKNARAVKDAVMAAASAKEIRDIVDGFF
jgi:nifR3 family TIM-barrel protein